MLRKKLVAMVFLSIICLPGLHAEGLSERFIGDQIQDQKLENKDLKKKLKAWKIISGVLGVVTVISFAGNAAQYGKSQQDDGRNIRTTGS